MPAASSPITADHPGQTPAWAVRHLPEIALALGVVGVAFILVLPIPTQLLDGLLAANMGVALLVLLVALNVGHPLRLSVFPAILLLTTLARLGLNVSSTRLILSQAYAGDVIQGFASFVVSGSFVVGAVIFLILTVIQFVVIAKGGERVAEVGARFALDAMPGRQMAIDADLRNGAINERQALLARDELLEESRLYGAMDGAMRFVKGDAIAGLFILSVDLLGGLAVGIVERGMPAGEAFATYGMLTIGDGIITQIPSLLIALAATLVVTRVASGRDSSKRELGAELFRQLGGHPRAFGLAALFLLALAFAPGLPALPFVVLAVGAAWIAYRSGGSEETSDFSPPRRLVVELPDPGRAAVIHRLVGRLSGELGVPLPRPETRGTGAEGFRYWIDGAPSLYVEDEARLEAALRGALPEIFSMEDLDRLLEKWAERDPSLVAAVVPTHVSRYDLTQLCRRLLRTGISLRRFHLVLEACLGVAEERETRPALDALEDAARLALGREVADLCTLEGRRIYVLGSRAEAMLRSGVAEDERGRRTFSMRAGLQTELVRDLQRALDGTTDHDAAVAIATTADCRRALEVVLEPTMPSLRTATLDELARGESAGATIVPAGTLDVGGR